MKNYILLFLMMMTAGMVMGQMKVFSDGKVKVGNTASSPAEKLEVGDGAIKLAGASGKNQQIIADVTDSNVGFYLRSRDGGAHNGDYAIFNLRGGNGDMVMSVRDVSMARWNEAFNYNYVNRALNVSGTIASNGTIIGSDKRLKKNIKSFNRGIESILKLNPVTYMYNGDMGTNDNEFHVGILAQDLQKVAPELVITKEFTQMDENYEKSLSTDNHLAIKDNEIKWMLVNAIKDQQEMIDGLREELEALKEELAVVDNTGAKEDHIVLSNESSNLGQNHPNPYQNYTSIAYQVASGINDARIDFHDITGKLIKSVKLTDSKGVLKVNSSELGNGNYTYSLVNDGRVSFTKKMTVLR